MVAPSNFKVAMACGVAGAYVDVTDYLRGNEPVTVNTGRESQFENTPPGIFSFTLDNSDGRFTPDNTSSALATRLVEDMGVCVQIGSRLTSGTIRSIVPFFRSMIGSSAQVRITCDDMLGDAGRQELLSFPDAMADAANQLMMWPLDDSAGSVFAVERNGGAALHPSNYDFGTATSSAGWVNSSAFGADAQSPVFGTRLRLCGTGTSQDILSAVIGGTTFEYPTTSMGFWGFWASLSADDVLAVSVRTQGDATGFSLQMSATSCTFTQTHAGTSAGTTIAFSTARNYVSVGTATTFSAGSWFRQFTLYINGVAVLTPATMNVGSELPNTKRQPAEVRVSGFAAIGGAGKSLVSRLSHTLTNANEQALLTPTLAGLVGALGYASPSVSFATLPTDLSTEGVAFSGGASSTLSRLNEVERTEQGAIYTTTTGTLTAPVQRINLRARTRPSAVSYTFDTTEISNAPDFARAISDAISAVTVTGTGATAEVVDSTLVPRFGTANSTARILNTTTPDLRSWGQDRLNRGVVQGVPITSITVNARNTPSDRWADLLAMIPGDRIRVTGLPSTQLGYSTWDGWLLGKKESHDYERGMFTLYLQPALPETAIYDTGRYMADGVLTLSASINAAVTSLSVATTLIKLSTTETPYTITIGTETMTVTACSSATPQVLTVTRGASGTTAAAHTAGDLVEITPSALYAF